MKGIVLVLFFLITLSAFAKFEQGRYVVFFTDKSKSEYSLSKPEEFLSDKALHRRLAQNISIQENDLPVCQLYIDELESCGIKIMYASKWLNAIVCSIEEKTELDCIKSKEFVLSVEWLAPIHIPQDYISVKNKAKKYSELTDDLYGDSYEQIALNKGDFLHTKGFDGKEILIAVLDAGFYAIDTEPKFANTLIRTTKDFVHIGGNVFKKHTHGASVLSVMCMNEKGFFYGTAPNASYILIRTEDSNSEYIIEEYNWIAGAEFADSCGADIINSSLGYNYFDIERQNHTPDQLDGKTAIISRGAKIATDKGMIVVNSAGNEGINEWKYICFPSDVEDVLTVGAVDKKGNYSSYSSVGPTTDNRIKPDVMAMGTNPLSFTKNQIFSTKSKGTSYAAPIIAGLAACLWQAFPDASSNEIVESIKKSGHLYKSPNYSEGYGIADFEKAYNYIYTQGNMLPFDISINPNPFIDSLIVEIQNISLYNSAVEIKLFNALSREVYSFTGIIKDSPHYIHAIYRNAFSAGTYIVTVKLNDYFFSKKIMVSY